MELANPIEIWGLVWSYLTQSSPISILPFSHYWVLLSIKSMIYTVHPSYSVGAFASLNNISYIQFY